MHSLRSFTLALLATTLSSIVAAEPASEPSDLGALRREFERRKTDAVRPVLSWYEAELTRLERSYTIRGNLDAALAIRKEREFSRTDLDSLTPAAFKTLLEETRWRWNGSVPEDITFKRDGSLEAREWTRQGFSVKWQVTSGNSVAYTILKGPAGVGKDVVLNFASDRNSFTGTNFDGLPIRHSPRLK